MIERGHGSVRSIAHTATVIVGSLLGLAGLAAPAMAAKEDRVFTIGNYPIEARAQNAVAAKERAIADGQQAALRSLLKRLVPVTAYRRLGKLKPTKAGDLVESFAVRSERNSSTDYIASYDFVFSADPVRRLLEREGIPYLDRQAPQIIIVPAYRIAPEVQGKVPPTFSASAGADAWLYAWKALDLANALTPVSVQPLKGEVHADTVRLLAEGDLGYLRTLTGAYGKDTVVLAVLEPDPSLKRLKVVLVGRDAVQNLYLQRSYRLGGQDLAYTAESAAIASLAILEGRWKAINVRPSAAPPESASVGSDGAASGWSERRQAAPGPAEVPRQAAAPAAASDRMTIAIQFRGMGEWQDISRQLAGVPDIADLDVLGLSASRARVALSYPRGPAELAVALASQGLILQNTRDGWLLTRR